MALRQMHYTSAPPGPDGSGFRFTAVSPGIAQETLRLAEPVLGYEPPRDAPSRPTEAELADFPVAFAYTRLPDGSALLSRTVYTGADYTGRYGNFHAHAVHLAPGEHLPHPERPQQSMSPVELWDSPSWQWRSPARGTPVELTLLEPGGGFGLDELCRFAVERAGELAAFLGDVHALFEQSQGPQLILVERDPRAVARWIALAADSLPTRCAAELTFTTYTRRPYRCGQLLIGIRPDAEFSFSAAELNHQFRVRHGLGGPSSPPRDDLWAQLAAQLWLAGRPDLIRQAVGSEGEFGVGGLAASALAGGIALTSAGRRAALDWADEHAGEFPDAFWDQFVDQLVSRDVVDTAALHRLGTVLMAAGRPAGTVDKLAATAVRMAALDPSAATAATGPALPLSAGARQRVALEIGPLLREELGRRDASLERTLGLLETAADLGVESTVGPELLAGRLAAALAGPDRAVAARVAALLTGPAGVDLLASVLDQLNDLARESDPRPVAALFGETLLGLGRSAQADYPHLRAAAVAGRSADRVSGVPLLSQMLDEVHTGRPVNDPLLLRTLYRLAWPTERPTCADARRMLAFGSPDYAEPGVLWRSGVVEELVTTVLAAGPTEAEASLLARELLVAFERDGLPSRECAALRALCFAEDIRAGRIKAGFAGEGIGLLGRAAPLEAPVAGELSGQIAERLLSGQSGLSGYGGEGVPEVLLYEELEALAKLGPVLVLAAYRERGAGAVMRRRFASDARYAAACFVAWHSYPGGSPGWDQARQELLEQVLRPTLRKMPPYEREQVGSLVGRVGYPKPGPLPWSELWQEWSRSGVSGRLTRWFGKGRSASGPARGRAADLTVCADEAGER